MNKTVIQTNFIKLGFYLEVLDLLFQLVYLQYKALKGYHLKNIHIILTKNLKINKF